MRVSYETIIVPNDAGTYDVACPDLAPHAVFTAADVADAAGLGARLTASAINRCIEQGLPLPTPTMGHRTPPGGCVLSIALEVELLSSPFPGCCTVAEAAAALKVSTSRVRALARAGRLKSSKYGNLWFISLESLNDRVAHPCRPGRPSKRQFNADANNEGLPAA